jgi:hypothetical protein
MWSVLGTSYTTSEAFHKENYVYQAKYEKRNYLERKLWIDE